MCYTVSIFSKTHVIESDTGALFNNSEEYQPFFFVNGFVHPMLPLIRQQGMRTVEMMQWGLVPNWINSEKDATDIANRTLNARSETVFEKPSFRKSIVSRRGLVPVDGFIEWRHNPQCKQPYLVRNANSALLLLGCVWDEWVSKETGESVTSFSILTTHANRLMSYVHNSKQRMPVIVKPSLIEEWLTSQNRIEVEHLMQSEVEGVLEAVPLSVEVSKRKINTDTPELLEPIGQPIH